MAVPSLRELVKKILGEKLSKPVGDFAAPILSLFNILKGIILNTSSQYGEDLVIDKLLKNKKNGVYIDIGANDPNLISNTRRFYQKGWHGVNIEPNSNLFRKIEKFRKKDINLNVGIGSQKGEINFYEFSADMLSTFNPESAKEFINQGYKIIREIKVPIIPLTEVFEKIKQPVDFMSLDVEGFEMEVLKSNDWTKNRPVLLLVEINKDSGLILDFLKNINYDKVWENHTNSIFIDKNQKEKIDLY